MAQSPIFKLRLDPQRRARWEERASQRGCSLSTWIIDCVENSVQGDQDPRRVRNELAHLRAVVNAAADRLERIRNLDATKNERLADEIAQELRALENVRTELTELLHR